MKTLLIALLLTVIGLPLYAAEPGMVRFVYMQDMQPACWSENDQPMGLQPEIAEQVAARLGLKADHGFYPWARANEMIRTGEADVMITTPTQARFAFAAFGKGKVMIHKWSMFTHKDNVDLIAKAKQFTRLEELKPYLLLDYLSNGWTTRNLQGEYRIHQVTSLEQVLRMLALKRGDLTIENPANIRWWAAKAGIDKELVEIPTQLPNTQFHFVFMVSRKSPWLQKGLVKGLDTALGEMKKSGEWARVTKKYGFPLETASFRSQLQTDQFYGEYQYYPAFDPK